MDLHRDPEMFATWLEACRRAVARQKEVLGSYGPSDAARLAATAGASGDVTLEIDRAFERIVLDEIESIRAVNGSPLRVISEELGGPAAAPGDRSLWVVIDPVDGSKNAANGVPQFSLSVALADGPSMADVLFGFVFDFGTDEEFVAERGGGALLNGEPVTEASTGLYRLVGCESAEPGLLTPALERLAESPTEEIRVVGSIAIALCYVALGRLDGLMTCKQCRSVDAAAGQLVARTLGVEVRFDGSGPEAAGLELSCLYRLVAARGALTGVLLSAQEAVPAVPR